MSTQSLSPQSHPGSVMPIATPERIRAELSGLAPLALCRGLEIFALYGDECPATMLEIGRLREVGFRAVGAGRGQALDLDDLDTGPAAYQQLVVWDPAEGELVALYRFQLGSRQREFGDACLRTSRLFDYSPAFREQGLHNAIELGRSVVNRQAKRAKLGFFALWAGLGVLLRRYEGIQYFFGNVSLYQSMHSEARDRLIRHLSHHYAPPEPWLRARPNVRYQAPETDIWPVVTAGETDTSDNRIRQLRKLLAVYQEGIPPIVQSYLSLSDSVWFGETVYDADFGDALEIGLVVPVAKINSKVRRTFIEGP